MTEEVRRIARTPLPGDFTPELDPTQQTIREYLNSRTLREKTGAQENRLKADLMEVLSVKGRVEGEGHRVIDLDEPWPLTTVTPKGEVKNKMIKGVMRQRKRPQTFDAEKALALVESKGIKDECVEKLVEYVLDEDKVLAANYAGKITDEEMEGLYTYTETYAFVPVEA